MTREVLRVRTVGVPRIMSTVNRGYVVRALRNSQVKEKLKNPSYHPLGQGSASGLVHKCVPMAGDTICHVCSLNSGRVYTHHVRRHEDGRTLVDVLAAAYRHSDADTWQSHLRAGRVRLDGRENRDGALQVREGQVISYHREPWREPAAPAAEALRELLRDGTFVALNKPPGLPVLPSEVYWDKTVVAALRSRHGNSAGDVPHPAHRLGVGTSGVLLCAIGSAARAALSRAFESRAVQKTYRTLVTGLVRRPKRKHREAGTNLEDEDDAAGDPGDALDPGDPGEDSFEISCPIGPVPHCSWGGSVHGARPDGGADAKTARSIVRVLKRDVARNCSLVEVQIPTGRPHQIRIHMAYVGHPLCGDPLYAAGGRPIAVPVGSDARPALPRDAGYLLHAWRAELSHPTTGEQLVLLAPPPAELALAGEAVSTYVEGCCTCTCASASLTTAA